MIRVLLNGLQANNRSGTGVYTAELARRLPFVAEDAEIRVAWPAEIPVPAGDERPYLLKNTHKPLGRIRYEQIGIHRDAARLRSDIVHFPATIGDLSGRLCSIVTLHDLSFLRDPEWFRPERALYYRHAARRSARTARLIIAVSEATARDIVDLLGVARERIRVVHNGVGEQFRPASREEIQAVRSHLKLPERFFLFLGTIEPRKNLTRVIEAWSAVAGACPQDLVLAGRQGWKVQPILDVAARSPLAHRIHFIGHVDQAQAPALYTAAEAFVFPSLYEGFGIPVLEAMACGCPAVTSNTSSLPEVAGEAALMVPPLDVEALAEALRRLAHDEALRAALRRKGYEQAAKFSWARAAHETLDAYRAAAG